MKVGGGLNYVVGPMGAGKTLYGVRRIVDAVLAGKYVITNIELYPDYWAERVAFHVAPMNRQKRLRVQRRIEGLYIYEADLHEAMRYRLPRERGEARGVFCWDEGHNDLNNRRWKDEGRAEILEWATQLRKLGFVGYLLSQHADNTDAALRRVCNFAIRLQNQKEQIRMLGLRVSPWPLFLAVWMPAHAPLVSRIEPVKIERYFLSWHRHLYDTWGLFHGLAAMDNELGVIHLPPGGLPQLRELLAADAAIEVSETDVVEEVES
jgi:hypothetical protein